MRTPTVVAIAVAVGAACYDVDKYNLTEGLIDDALTLELNDTGVSSVPADGFSRITLRVAVDVAAASDRRTVVITTTAGQLAGAAAGAPQTLELTVPSDGTATFDLIADRNIQIARIRANIKTTTVTQELSVPFVAPSIDSIVRFVAVPIGLEADGDTQGEVTVQIATAIGESARKVKLETTRGDFGETGVTSVDIVPDATGRASARLRSGSAGIAALRATVAGFSRDTSLLIQPARPDTILLDISPLSAKVDQNVAVTARLVRSRGTTTMNTRVDFDAFDEAGTRVGQFLNVQLSDATGRSTATFSAVGTTPNTRVRIVATAAGRVGETFLRIDP